MANELDGSAKNRETERALLEVIKSLQDSQKGLAEIGEHLKEPDLKRHFLAESLRRANFRAELENELHREGVADVKESGSVAGALHRAWADIKAHLGGGDHALLDTAIDGEKATLDTYNDALDLDLPLPVRELLTDQLSQISNSEQFLERHKREHIPA